MRDENNAPAIRTRFETLFGEHEQAVLVQKIAAVTGRRRTAVYSWLDEGFPVHAVQTLDLLERLPHGSWPDWAMRATHA